MPKATRVPTGLRIEALLDDRVRVFPIHVLSRPRFQMLAVRWSKLAARRQQWSERDSDADTTRAIALETIEESGMSKNSLRLLFAAAVIQVVIPWEKREEKNWEARIMPWEFVIHQSLRCLNAEHAVPPIVRHLEMPGKQQPPATGSPAAALLLLNSPPRGTEEEAAIFQRETDIIAAAFSASVLHKKNNLDAAAIRRLLENEQITPGRLLLHFAAIDEMRPGTGPLAKKMLPHVWMPVTGEDGRTRDWITFEEAAQVLTHLGGNGGIRAPWLVSLPFNHSGPRFAALAVAHGASAAIGFQDVADESVRVNFFGAFYEHCRAGGWDLLDAFRNSIKDTGPLLRGTGIILWSRSSLLHSRDEHAKSALPKSRSKGRKMLASAPQKVSGTAKLVPQDTHTVPPTPESVATPPQRALIDAEPVSSLNYAVMHNQSSWDDARDSFGERGPLFRKFNVPRLLPGVDPANPEAEITISLQAGDLTTQWRELVPLKNTDNPLARSIRVPLTSVLARTIGESIHTLIEAEIRVVGNLVYRRSFNTTLLAIDEWRDDGVAHIFLPSFVHSRDPAVRDLIRLARQDLCSIMDDFHAGFDGYQSGDPLAVDRQVQSIWSAIVQEWQLAYINPPPTFSQLSQRLRRPGRIREERAGTCIDLALLLAAALEYVDIRPLLVLAPGHAYLAYCREPAPTLGLFSKISESPDAPKLSNDEADRLSRETRQSGSQRDTRTWVYGPEQHKQIVEALNDGRIAAIEATGITRRIPFAQAIEEGSKKLRRRLEFDCLIDVYHARHLGVTPLPVIFEGPH